MSNTEIPQRINISGNNPVVSQKVSALRGEIMKENSQLLNDQVQKMRQFQQKLSTILSQISQNKAACLQTIANLRTQIEDLDYKVNNYQIAMNSNNTDQQYHNQIRNYNHELKQIYEERIKLAKEINIKHLNKVEIDDKKSIANELFKWILVAIYNEPDNKYFWPNFQEQAFENDKGADFIERLGKINATKEEHKLKTESFLADYPKILAAPELQKCRDDVQKIYRIAQLFKKAYETSAAIKDTQKAIQKFKESTLEKDEEFMRWKARSEALKDRIHINQSYLQVLNETEQKLAPKIAMYNEKITSGQTLKSEFENFDKWSPTINLGQEHKSNCECTLF